MKVDVLLFIDYETANITILVVQVIGNGRGRIHLTDHASNSPK